MSQINSSLRALMDDFLEIIDEYGISHVRTVFTVIKSSRITVKRSDIVALTLSETLRRYEISIEELLDHKCRLDTKKYAQIVILRLLRDNGIPNCDIRKILNIKETREYLINHQSLTLDEANKAESMALDVINETQKLILKLKPQKNGKENSNNNK